MISSLISPQRLPESSEYKGRGIPYGLSRAPSSAIPPPVRGGRRAPTWSGGAGEGWPRGRDNQHIKAATPAPPPDSICPGERPGQMLPTPDQVRGRLSPFQ